MLPGANSVKEELHNWGWDFNKRGLATIALDGPGQGELSVRNGGVPLRFESYHESVVAVLDYVEGLQGVPADRVAVWGQSTGGHLAIRGAAHDERIAAAVSLGGGYDFRLETAATTPVDVREEARDLHGFDSFREAEEYVRAEGSLKLIIGRVSAPLLLIHGGQDNIVALEEMEQIKEEASGPTELWVYPDGNHSVCNLNLEMSPRMADWVLAVLAGQVRPRR
jgi:2,6-dihydroxypseudooxynicotine hydrolase